MMLFVFRPLIKLVRRYVPAPVEEACALGPLMAKAPRLNSGRDIVFAFSWSTLHAATKIDRAVICWHPLTPRVFRDPESNSILYPGVGKNALPVMRRWMIHLGKRADLVVCNQTLSPGAVRGLGFTRARLIRKRANTDFQDIVHECVKQHFSGDISGVDRIQIILSNVPRGKGAIDQALRQCELLTIPAEIILLNKFAQPDLAARLQRRYPNLTIHEASERSMSRLTMARTRTVEFIRVIGRAILSNSATSQRLTADEHSSFGLEASRGDDFTGPDMIGGLGSDRFGAEDFQRGSMLDLNDARPGWAQRNGFMGSPPIIERMAQFQSNVERIADLIPADLVHSVDLISAGTGKAIAERHHARHVIDVNEFPLFEHRIGREFASLRPGDFEMLNAGVKRALDAANGAVAYSAGLARITRMKFDKQTLPIRNFHDLQPLTPNKTMRQDFGIPDDARLLVHVCTMAPQYNTQLAVDAMEHLPDSYHLVFVGSPMREDYGQELAARAQALGIAERVHFKGEIGDQSEYLAYVSGADFGVVMMADDIPNVRFGMSNRFTDLLAAGVPMVSTYTVETAPILRGQNMGAVVKNPDAVELASAIQDVFETPGQLEEFKRNTDRVRREYSWENEAGRYIELLTGGRDIADRSLWSHGGSIVFVFQRGLVRNRRTLRFAREFMRHGWTVTFLVGTVPASKILGDIPQKRFVQIPHGAPLTQTGIASIGAQLGLSPLPNDDEWEEDAKMGDEDEVLADQTEIR